MTTSINQPWSISDKFRNRYGNTWADLDFTFEPKISAENFKTDPMNCLMGQLHICNQTVKVYYKDLIIYAKQLTNFMVNMYGMKPKKEDVFAVDFKGRTFMLTKHEVAKFAQTISDALDTSIRSYELGLYL